MKSKIINLILFAAGAAIGSAVTWKVVTKKYDEIVEKEIASIKEVLLGDHKEEEKEPEKPDPMARYRRVHREIVESNGYVNYSNSKIEEKGVAEVKKPYVITADEYGEIESHEIMNLTLYGDGVLADDWDEPIDDLESVIGGDALVSFDDEETVFVRNEELGFDYEVTYDPRNYSDVVDDSPHQVDEDE